MIIHGNPELINDKLLFVLDMDGTFYLDNNLFDGSLEFIEKIRSVHRDFLFFTNNSSKTLNFYIRKLRKMGCCISSKEIMNSTMVTIGYIKSKYQNSSVYVVGTEEVLAEMKKGGINIVEDKPDIVLITFDIELTYEKLSKACHFVRGGSIFMATHEDYNCPTIDGFIPDCGAICSLITASTGVIPKYIGKPHIETMEAIISYKGVEKDKIVVIGDRLYTDIALGTNHGVTSILVMTGETTLDLLNASKNKPDIVTDRLSDITTFII